MGLRPHRFAQRREERLHVRGEHRRRARRRADHRPDHLLLGVGRKLGGQDHAHQEGLVGGDPDPAAGVALRQQAAGPELGVPGLPLHRRAAGDRPVDLRPARRRGADRVLRTPRRPRRPQGGRRAGAAAVRPRLRTAARRQPDGCRGWHLGERLGRPRSQVAHRPGPHLRRRAQPGLLAGRARPGHPEPRHLRDLPAGEAPLLPGGDRRLLVPDAGLLFAPHRQRAGGPVAAERCLQQRRAGQRPGAGDDLRRGKAGRPPQPQLDDRGAQRGHCSQRRHHLRTRRSQRDQPVGGAGHRVQRPAPQARARQRRPHRHHRHRLDDVREQRRLPAADR